jgi:hypothetical protein
MLNDRAYGHTQSDKREPNHILVAEAFQLLTPHAAAFYRFATRMTHFATLSISANLTLVSAAEMEDPTGGFHVASPIFNRNKGAIAGDTWTCKSK